MLPKCDSTSNISKPHHRWMELSCCPLVAVTCSRCWPIDLGRRRGNPFGVNTTCIQYVPTRLRAHVSVSLYPSWDVCQVTTSHRLLFHQVPHIGFSATLNKSYMEPHLLLVPQFRPLARDSKFEHAFWKHALCLASWSTHRATNKKNWSIAKVSVFKS